MEIILEFTSDPVSLGRDPETPTESRPALRGRHLVPGQQQRSGQRTATRGCYRNFGIALDLSFATGTPELDDSFMGKTEPVQPDRAFAVIDEAELLRMIGPAS